MLFASSYYSGTSFVLILSPYVLLVLALVIFILAAGHVTTVARYLLLGYAAILVWMSYAGQVWQTPAHLWDQPFFALWYVTAWLDLALLPCLALWVWRRSSKR